MAPLVLKTVDVVLESKAYRLPRVINYNRLEGSPRTTDFTGSLRAEVRDPLWMLTRQWQLGEFQGEDAASPVTARIAYQHHRTGLVSLRDADAFRFDPTTMPLEARVEREPLPLTLRAQADGKEFSDVLFAVRWGKRLLQMLKDAGIDGDYPLYRDRFPIRVLDQDAEALAIGRAVATRIADGVAIWRSVTLGTHDAWLNTTGSVNKAALQ